MIKISESLNKTVGIVNGIGYSYLISCDAVLTKKELVVYVEYGFRGCDDNKCTFVWVLNKEDIPEDATVNADFIMSLIDKEFNSVLQCYSYWYTKTDREELEWYENKSDMFALALGKQSSDRLKSLFNEVKSAKSITQHFMSKCEPRDEDDFEEICQLIADVGHFSKQHNCESVVDLLEALFENYSKN